MSLIFLGVIMKDFLAKEMSKFLDDSSSSYEFPIEFYTGGYTPSSGYTTAYGYKRNDKEEFVLPYTIENSNADQVSYIQKVKYKMFCPF